MSEGKPERPPEIGEDEFSKLVVAQGYTVQVFIDTKTFRPLKPDPSWRIWMKLREELKRTNSRGQDRQDGETV